MNRELKEIADKIGLGDALELVRRWGGRQLDVPIRVKITDPLALAMGYESARKLVEHFGGRRFELPIERNALLDLRNAAILAEVAAGDSHEKVAVRYGMTRKNVQYIIRKNRELAEIRAKFAASGRAVALSQSRP